MHRIAGLEAVAYAWDELRRIPATALWEKPQGKGEPIRMDKHFRDRAARYRVWLLAAAHSRRGTPTRRCSRLATGNAVIVKPHPLRVLPAAITVKIAREVLAESRLRS